MTKKREERLQILTQTDGPLWDAGIVFAGMDEAGRGPLAGNVVAACVVMPKEPLRPWVDDSKKLSPLRRDQVFDEIYNEDKVVIVQTAPAVRSALGEEFGLPIGTAVTGKMVAALRRIGFDKVFDTDTGADLTIMEEGTELLDRIKNGG